VSLSIGVNRPGFISPDRPGSGSLRPPPSPHSDNLIHTDRLTA